MSIPEKQSVVLIRETGGPEVLRYETDFPTPKIANPNEILIKNKYSGVNFIESYFRKGIYPSEKPYVLGREALGVVVEKGASVKDYNIGDHILYMSPGTFAQYTKVTAGVSKLIKLPQTSTQEELKTYAAALLQGLTVLTFVEEAYAVKKGDYILVWAASGGVGLIFDQILHKLGAHVIAVASTEEKLALAKENGAEYGILYDDPELLKKIEEITKGEGVDAVFDSIGKDTFETSLKAVKRKGSLISFGNATGPVDPLVLNRLSPKNVKIARPQVMAYIHTEEEFEYYAKKLIDYVKNGDLKIKIYKTYELKDYVQAAKDIESRKTTGKLLLEIPN